ncbi:hypothetical protein [Streptomyces vinaceus]|uniref:hypothetical protein n=1 Tax=Streptomyces vinaceus TaxID=1960 RepID=UPI0036A54C64
MPDAFAALSALVPPAVRAAPIGSVALYAVVPTEADGTRVLGELRSYVAGRGWHVPVGCAVADVGVLGANRQRSGWRLVRCAVQVQAITGLVVPCFAHIGHRWADWNRERMWLLRRGLFVMATDPNALPVGVSPEEVLCP